LEWIELLGDRAELLLSQVGYRVRREHDVRQVLPGA
jgi:hypothetical protein